MKFVLKQPTVFKDILSVMTELITEGTLICDADGIKFRAMDNANVAMIILNINKALFDEYIVKDTESLAMNFNNLKGIFRKINADDIMTFETESSKVKIVFAGKTKRTFHQPIIEAGEDPNKNKEPNIQYTMRITMPSGLFSESIEDAGISGDSVDFITEPGMFHMVAEGDNSKAQVDIAQDEKLGVVVTLLDKTDAGKKIEYKAKFSLEYLKKMMVGSKLAENISIRYGKDIPVALEFSKENVYKLGYYLAPRIDSSD